MGRLFDRGFNGWLVGLMGWFYGLGRLIDGCYIQKSSYLIIKTSSASVHFLKEL